MKEIGAAWKQLGEAEKQPFQQAAAAAQAAYRKDFEAYCASGKLAAWKRDPAKPQKPLTPFFVWANQERQSADISKLPVVEAAKALGASWAKVPQSTKDPMTAKYKTEMEQYNEQIKSYKNSGAETRWLEKTGRLDIQKKAEAKKQAAKDKDSAKKQAAKKQAAKKQAAKKLAAKKQAAKKQMHAAKEQQKKKAIAAKAKEQSALRKEKMQLAKEKAKAKSEAEKARTKAAPEKKKATLLAAAAKDAPSTTDPASWYVKCHL